MSEPLRCDFCETELTEGLLFEHGPFRFEHAGRILDAERGAFLACPACAELLNAGKSGELADVAAAVYNATVIQRQLFARLYEEVLKHLTGKRHVTAADRPPSRGWFTQTCFRCGFDNQVDGASYDRSKTIHCAQCGVDILIVSHPTV